MMRWTAMASSTERANTDTVSTDRQAGTTPRGGHAADGRLQPDDVAEGSGHAAGSGGVRAQGKRHDAGRNRAGRAGRRSAGHSAEGRTHCVACRTGCACRRGPSRTGRGSSCRSAARRRRANAAPRVRTTRPRRRSRDRRRWLAARRRRCCPSPRTARPIAAGRAGLHPAACAPGPARRRLARG